ncbi:MarR family transcriptional regulator [Bacillus mycoides]|uniref:MarR family transcriptional regulator n=1 Tax=Bacillus mycoides TaxID=1405 RepID=A0A1S9T6N2_BACMY|nr:MarR family transcriptional regulator [Bacillus mycoides]OOR05675.1 MarR family transcriptional regulator [Bacillus mycoides]
MGAWGTGLFDDDTTCDVKDQFIDYLDEGNSAEEATKLVLEEYLDEFDIDEDLEEMSLVFIGLAAIQLEKGCIQDEVRSNAITLIERGADLELWEEAGEEDYDERKKVLNTLKQQLINCCVNN